MSTHPLAALVGAVGGAIAGASGATSLADKLFPAEVVGGVSESITDRPWALTVLIVAGIVAAVLGAMSAWALAESNGDEQHN
jgi:hypothetical protein